MHSRYLQSFGLDAGLFPQPTDWILIWGYYGFFERTFAAVLFFASAIAWFLIAGLIFSLLLAAISGSVGKNGVPARNDMDAPVWAFAKRVGNWFHRLLVPPSLFTFFVFLMWLVGTIAETAGDAMAKRQAAEFRKGCAMSRQQCVELHRDGKVFATGFVLDSSPSHIGFYDVATDRARAMSREGIELVGTRGLQHLQP